MPKKQMYSSAHRNYVTIEAAAEHLNVTPMTIRRWISDGILPAYRFGPRILRIALEDIDAIAKPVPHSGTGARPRDSFRYNTRG